MTPPLPLIAPEGMTCVRDRILALESGGSEQQKRFLQNGGWSLLHDWIQQAITSKNAKLLHSILKLLTNLPTDPVLAMLKEGGCPIIPVLESIIKEELEEIETRRLCHQVLLHWQLILTGRVGVEDEKANPRNGVKLGSVEFRIRNDEGDEMIVHATPDRIWKITLNGEMRMVMMKEEYWRRLHEPLSDEEEDNPPLSSALVPWAPPPPISLTPSPLSTIVTEVASATNSTAEASTPPSSPQSLSTSTEPDWMPPSSPPPKPPQKSTPAVLLRLAEVSRMPLLAPPPSPPPLVSPWPPPLNSREIILRRSLKPPRPLPKKKWEIDEYDEFIFDPVEPPVWKLHKIHFRSNMSDKDEEEMAAVRKIRAAVLTTTLDSPSKPARESDCGPVSRVVPRCTSEDIPYCTQVFNYSQESWPEAVKKTMEGLPVQFKNINCFHVLSNKFLEPPKKNVEAVETLPRSASVSGGNGPPPPSTQNWRNGFEI